MSRATVGEGEIIVRDKAKQKELESSGKTNKLANLNRDLDKTQEVTKDEEVEINLYVSDTSIRTAVKIVEVAGKSFDKIFDELATEIADLLSGTKEAQNAYGKAVVTLKKKMNVSKDELKKATELLATEEGQELIQEKLKTEEGRQQVTEYLKSGGCSSGREQQGFIFSPLDLLITPAYAEPATATVCLASGPPGWVVGAAIVVVGGTIVCLQTDCLSSVSDAIGSLLNSQSNSGNKNARDPYTSDGEERKNEKPPNRPFPPLLQSPEEEKQDDLNNCVYSCVVDGVTRYVGITNNIVVRGQAHLREKGIAIRKIPGMSNLSRSDVKAVEQTLIRFHGLGKKGGTLINKINSISKVKHPTKYEKALLRGTELLKQQKYPGF